MPLVLPEILFQHYFENVRELTPLETKNIVGPSCSKVD